MRAKAYVPHAASSVCISGILNKRGSSLRSLNESQGEFAAILFESEDTKMCLIIFAQVFSKKLWWFLRVERLVRRFQHPIHRRVPFKNLFWNLILKIFSSKIIIIIYLFSNLLASYFICYILFLLYSCMRHVPRTNSDFSGLMIVDRTVKSVIVVVPLQAACVDFTLIHSERRVAREWIRADASLSRDSRRLVIITGSERGGVFSDRKNESVLRAAQNSGRIASSFADRNFLTSRVLALSR